MQNNYCNQCPKQGTCKAASLLTSKWVCKMGEVHGLGINTGWIDYPEIKAISECPFLSDGLEKAITNEFQSNGENQNNRYFITCRWGDEFHCHQEEKEDPAEIAARKKSAEIKFNNKVKQRLKRKEQSKPKTYFEPLPLSTIATALPMNFN